jgi:tRNA A37 threonylcarbamoyladenosine modification protein TsaB
MASALRIATVVLVALALGAPFAAFAVSDLGAAANIAQLVSIPLDEHQGKNRRMSGVRYPNWRIGRGP